MRRRHYAPPVSRTAGGAIKGTPQENRRYILFNPILAVSYLTFLTFSKIILPYIEFITRLGLFLKNKWDYTPLQSPLGDYPHVGRFFFSIFFRFDFFFLKHAHMEFITRLGHFFFVEIFSGTFFRGTTPRGTSQNRVF